MWKEFKDFVFKGNVLDLAIAFILGVAFAAVVSSLVKDIIMPPIGLALGGIDFSSLYINLSGKSYASLADAAKAGAPTINYGLFINTVITFLIVASVLFMIVRAYNRMRPATAAPVSTKACPYCQTDIPLSAVRCPNCTSQLAAAS
jgi:large conductance mechanosensitive channel